MKINLHQFYLVLSIILIGQLGFAQNFSRVPQFYPISGLQNSSAVFKDMNGDEYPDLLISGKGRESTPMTILCLNDGHGNFLEKSHTSFEGVHYSAMAMADVNGDGFIDIVISGSGSSSALPIKLYINDGAGNFSEMSDFPNVKIWDGALVLEDVNGDQSPDLIVTGRRSFKKPTTIMFFNDGKGHFKEVKESAIIDVYDSSLAVKDVNGDSHPDVLITGLVSKDEPVAKLYINDGTGNFSESTESKFTGVGNGSVALEDMNGDGYPEVLISGKGTSFHALTRLYTNDGTGNFTETEENPFYGKFHSSSATVEDLDGDGDSDVLINGRKLSGDQFTKVYMNEGQGIFTEKKETLRGLIDGFMITADVNNDAYSDILIGGQPKPDGDPITKLYINDGAGNFSEKRETLTGVGYSSSIVTADINGDQHNDLCIAGSNNAQKNVMTLHVNDGRGNFTKVRRTRFKGTIHSISVADANGDGTADVLVTGWDYGAITKLYLNNGAGKFSELKDNPFTGVMNGTSVMTDLNGDDHADVLITGDMGDSLITKLYWNDGSGNFIEAKERFSSGTRKKSIAVADVNGDSYPDVFISGYDEDGDAITELYTNDSLGQFKKVMDTPFIGGANSIVATDMNADGFIDVLIAGSRDGYSAIRLYINDGKGHFKEVKDNPFEAIYDNALAVGDFNGDELPEVITFGNNGATPILKMYRNDGKRRFTEISEPPFTALLGGAIAIADLNGDGRLDVITAGKTSSEVCVTTLYMNEGKE
ncbi:MAG: VCBS repeat-containing protein [Saprospiraceae bacterium]|nr:VCBS repeat-containing protein [Saprospiraceae bacterium]